MKYLLMIYLRCVETIHGEGAVHLHYETRYRACARPRERTAAIFDLAPGGHVGRPPPGAAACARPAAQTACSSSPP